MDLRHHLGMREAQQLRQLAGGKPARLELRAHGPVEEQKVIARQDGLEQPSTLIAHHEPPSIID